MLDHILGDINSKTFSEIWAGKQYKFFRKRVMDSREKIDMCRNCTTGLFPELLADKKKTLNFCKKILHAEL